MAGRFISCWLPLALRCFLQPRKLHSSLSEHDHRMRLRLDLANDLSTELTIPSDDEIEDTDLTWHNFTNAFGGGSDRCFDRRGPRRF